MTIKGLNVRFVLFCVNKVFAGTKEKHFEIKRKMLNSIGYNIGKGTRVVGPIYCSGKLVIGENCWIGRNLCVQGNGMVEIANNCDIAPDVVFQTGSHEIGLFNRRAGDGFNKDIKVGNGCWIGTRSTILCGVEIHQGSVIAACACVNKDVESNTVVGGVPAKTIKKLTDMKIQ